jgi:hypothetical protein
LFKGVAYQCCASDSIIRDEEKRAQMTQWMANASTAKPPAKAADFCVYVNTVYNANIRSGLTLVVAQATQTHAVGSIIGVGSELLDVPKGIRQILSERRVQFDDGCLQERHVRTAAAYNKSVVTAYAADRGNVVLMQRLLTMRKSAQIAAEARDIACSRRILRGRSQGLRRSIWRTTVRVVPGLESSDWSALECLQFILLSF